MHRCYGISTSTVRNVIDRVTPAILSLRRELFYWPKQPLRIPSKFYDNFIAGFPCVAGCVDRTDVLVNPPARNEDTYGNRNHSKSVNVAMVCWPDYYIYFFSSRCPGRLHDSEFLKGVRCGLHWKKMRRGFSWSSYPRRLRLHVQQLADSSFQGRCARCSPHV